MDDQEKMLAPRLDDKITDVIENISEVMEQYGCPEFELRIRVGKFYRLSIGGCNLASKTKISIERFISRKLEMKLDPIALELEMMIDAIANRKWGD